MKTIKIAERSIGPGHRPFVIAEMSGNHNQSKQRSLALVKAAAEAGVDALKLQTYTADTMTLNLSSDEFYVGDSDNPWCGQSLYELYEKAHTPWEWHREIFDYANSLGMLAFSSPFDETAVDFLQQLDVPAYKVASFELTDIPLLRKIGATGKPVIMSTGMATLAEIEESVTALREAGCEQMVLLKCTSTYPASAEHSNLKTIPNLRDLFDCQVGLSDHTLGIGAAVAAVALGAGVIEKHFTLQRSDGGVDAAFSLEPAELAALVEEVNRAWLSLGEISYGCDGAQAKAVKYRRSVYASADIAAGEKLTPDNIRVIRPGLGLKPKYFPRLLGKRLRKSVTKGTPIHWELF